MRALITGGSGQLGRALARKDPDAVALALEHLDICDPSMIDLRLDAIKPDVVINAAAYTAVDQAEDEPERAHAVNATGAGNLARQCAARGIRMLHVSTDYVFDGTARTPYREDAPIAPLGVYGASKAAGEREVRTAGGTVVRTSWLFEERGPSFVHTMLRLCIEREVLRVVSDQHGCPTWADDLAKALLALAALPKLASTYHYCNEGPTTWHAFATSIIEEARRVRPVKCQRVDAITTAEYPTPAKRPAYSVLDTSLIRSAGIATPPWSVGLRHVVAAWARGRGS